MSTRIEWMDADYIRTQLVRGGEPIGQDSVDFGKLGLAIAADTVVVFEGTRDSLMLLLERMIAQLGAVDSDYVVCDKAPDGGTHHYVSEEKKRGQAVEAIQLCRYCGVKYAPGSKG